MKKPIVSIIILVHNAFFYTLITLFTLHKTKNVNFEVVVLDNNSKFCTRLLLLLFYKIKYINTLVYSKTNTFFSKGNNIATNFASQDSKYYLLLNSDVKIKNKDWLDFLIKNHSFGISALGVVGVDTKIARCDGYCFMIDKILYDKYKLDENFLWWWSITKLQGEINKQVDTTIKGYIDSDNMFIHHYGGKSGTDYLQVDNSINKSLLDDWFTDNKIEIIKLKR